MNAFKLRLLRWDLEDAYWMAWCGETNMARRKMQKIVDEYFKEEERGKRK